MQTRNPTTALAFLVAAFMWGCQEEGSNPVAPESVDPQFMSKAKDKGKTNGAFIVEVSGHISGSSEDGRGGTTKDLGRVELRDFPLMALDSKLQCSLGTGTHIGDFHIEERADKTIRTSFYFGGGILHSLRLRNGTVDSGDDWLPVEPGDETTITGFSWRVRYRGNGNTKECEVDGFFETPYTITVTRK